MKKLNFLGLDGKKIEYKEWSCDEPKGILQISHGMAESSVRYEKFAEFMASKGYIVIADDHRGHGSTDTDRTGYTSGDMFSDTVDDMAVLTKLYKEKYKGLKTVLFGHSYGSFLTQSYIERYGDLIDGAIIGGSAYMCDISTKFGSVVAKLNKLFGREKKPAKFLANASFGMYNKKFDKGTFISSIEEECKIYEQNEECGFILSYNFYLNMFKHLNVMYKEKNYKGINVDKPVLLIAGSCDPVGNFTKSVNKLYDFYVNKVGVKSVGKIIYDGVRHEYLNDTSRQKAYNDIREFVDDIVEND